MFCSLKAQGKTTKPAPGTPDIHNTGGIIAPTIQDKHGSILESAFHRVLETRSN